MNLLENPIVAHCSQVKSIIKEYYSVTSNPGHSPIKSFTHKYSYMFNQKQIGTSYDPVNKPTSPSRR